MWFHIVSWFHNLCFLVITVRVGNKPYTTGKPVYFPFIGATFVRKEDLVGGLSSKVEYVCCAHEKTCQIFSISARQLLLLLTCLVPFPGLDDWSLKKQDILVACGRTIDNHKSLAVSPHTGHQLGHPLPWDGITLFNQHLLWVGQYGSVRY